MSIDISVPGGNPNMPGFSVQRSSSGLSISAGDIASTNTMFGMANDEGGLSVSAYPVSTISWLVRACVSINNVFSTLWGDVTVDRLDTYGVAIQNIVTRRMKVWTFCPTGLSDCVFTNVSGLFPYTGPDNPGCGKLLAGRYRLSIYWAGFDDNPPYEGSENVIQEVLFTIGGPPTPAGYVFTIPAFMKRDNTVSPEW